MSYIVKILQPSRSELETKFHDLDVVFERRSNDKSAIYLADLTLSQVEVLSQTFPGIEITSTESEVEFGESSTVEPKQPEELDIPETAEDAETKDVIKVFLKIAAVAVVAIIVIAFIIL